MGCDKYITKQILTQVRGFMRNDRIIKLPVFRAMFTPVARKAWKCNLCKAPVEVGDRYVHYIDRRPREIISYRFHKDCFKIVEAYCQTRHRTSFTPRSVYSWATKAFCGRCQEEGCKLKPCAKIIAEIKFDA